MKTFCIRFLKRLRQLVDFYQPCFLHLDCIDLVLENKLLLLISWDTAHTAKVRIRPGKITFRKSTSAAVCQLPAGTDKVEIILCNTWRRKKLNFPLKRISVDQQTLHYLDGLFPLRIFLLDFHAEFVLESINLKNYHPEINLAIPALEINISINQLQLNDYAP